MIKREGWLNDNIIADAQSPTKDFPSMGGLQQSALQDSSIFVVPEGEFVQIFHVCVVITGV